MQGAGQRAGDVGARGDLLVADSVPSVERANSAQKGREEENHYLKQ